MEENAGASPQDNFQPPDFLFEGSGGSESMVFFQDCNFQPETAAVWDRL
jgi:hypothetical protein